MKESSVVRAIAFAFLPAALIVAPSQRDTQPRLVPLIADLGMDAGGITVAESGLVYFGSSDGIRCYDPVRRTSFVVDSGVATDLAVSPKGDYLAFARGDPLLAIWSVRVDPSSGRAVTPPRRLSVRSGRAPAISPDGRWVAFSVLPADTLVGPRIVRLPSSGGPEQVVSREAGFAQNLRWSPDGHWIYYRHGMVTAAGQLRTLHRVHANGGVAEQLTRIGEFVGLSPDGQRLAYITNLRFHADPGPKHVIIGDSRGRVLRRFDLPADAMPISWGPGPQQLLVRRAAGSGLTSIHFADLNGRIRELTPPGPSESLSAVLPDGQHVLFQSIRGERRELTSLELASGTRRVIFSSRLADGRLVWLGHNFVALFGSDSVIRIVDLVTRRERRLNNRECPVVLTGAQKDSTILCMRSGIGIRDIRSVKLADGTSTPWRRINVPEQGRPSIRAAGGDLLVLSFGGRVMTTPVIGGPLHTVYAARRHEDMTDADVGASPDGAWIGIFTRAVGKDSANGFLRLVSTRTGTVRSLPISDLPVTRVVSAPMWDPDDRYVAMEVENGRRVDIWIIPLNGDRPFPLTRSEANGSAGLILAADGSGVLYNTDAPTRMSSTALWTADLSARAAVAAK